MSFVHDPGVSVITINGGRDLHLSRLLEGLLKGQRPKECIVVDFGGLAYEDDGFFKRIPLSALGLPLALARNTGRRHASGEILIFLDVDCIPSTDLVAALTRAVITHDGLICCDVRYLPYGAVSDGWTETQLQAVGASHPARSRAFPECGVAAAPHPGLFWSLAFGVRTRTFDRLGGFDDGFSGYGAEDTDLAFRAAAVGIPILFTAEGCAYHQRHEGFDPPIQHLDDIARNAVRFHRRHGFWPMRDWLDAFARIGLLDFKDDRLVVSRRASAEEVEAARIPLCRPF